MHDQWVSIGRIGFRKAGLWMKTKDPELFTTNRSLKYQNFIEIIKKKNPVGYISHAFRKNKYLLLEHKSPD